MTVGPLGNRIINSEEIAQLVNSGHTVSATETVAVPSDIHAPHKLQKTVEASSSLARFWNTRFDPYNRTQLSDLYHYDEPSFYQDYEESYKTNPFTFMLVESVISQVIGDGYHFEGPGANVVEEFFWEDDTRTKIEMLYRDTVRFGNGLMDFVTQGGRLLKTRVLNPNDILITIDMVPESLTYGERTYWQFRNQLDAHQIIHDTIRPIAGAAYGMSILRPNIVFLQALLDCGGDVLAAVKRVGYAPIVASLDLDGYRTEQEKRDAIHTFEESMKETESAVNNFVIDRRNSINLLGAGSAGARLLPINDLIEPWIAVCLRNFGFPIGLFLQQGANKAIVDAQREDVRVGFANLRDKLKYRIEKWLLPRITNRKCGLVWNRPPPSSPETQASFKMYLLAYQLGVLSKEFILDYFDITDEGATFYEGPPTQGGSHSLGASNDG
jgi:hypothetical protein